MAAQTGKCWPAEPRLPGVSPEGESGTNRSQCAENTTPAVGLRTPLVVEPSTPHAGGPGALGLGGRPRVTAQEVYGGAVFPPPKYGKRRIAHTRGCTADVSRRSAFYGAKRLGHGTGGGAREPTKNNDLASQRLRRAADRSRSRAVSNSEYVARDVLLTRTNSTPPSHGGRASS